MALPITSRGSCSGRLLSEARRRPGTDSGLSSSDAMQLCMCLQEAETNGSSGGEMDAGARCLAGASPLARTDGYRMFRGEKGERLAIDDVMAADRG